MQAWWLIAAAVLTGVTSAQTKTERTFHWPAGVRAVVTETRDEASPRGRLVAVLRYSVVLQRTEDGCRLLFGNVEVVRTQFPKGSSAKLRSVIGRHTMRRVRPTIELTKSGAVQGISGLAAALDRSIAGEQPLTKQRLRRALGTPKLRAVFEQRQRQLWNEWVQRWRGVQAGRFERRVREPLPSGTRIDAVEKGVVKATKKGGLALESTSVLDSKATRNALQRALRGKQVREVRIEIRRHALLLTDTRLPRRIQVRRVGSATLEGAAPQPMREIVTWDFDWKTPAAAPAGR